MFGSESVKRKGFTLIELLVVLSILSCCILIVYPKLGRSSEEKEEKILEDTTDEVIEFINLCKSKSREKGKQHTVSLESHSVIFRCAGSKIDTLELPPEIKLQGMNRKESIYIDHNGNVMDKCSFSLISSKGRKNEISIKVGTGYVSRKKKRDITS